MKPLVISTFTLILTLGIWQKWWLMKRMMMNFTYGHCLTVPIHLMKMVTGHGFILGLKVSSQTIHQLFFFFSLSCVL